MLRIFLFEYALKNEFSDLALNIPFLNNGQINFISCLWVQTATFMKKRMLVGTFASKILFMYGCSKYESIFN